jgi:hypothetical protein
MALSGRIRGRSLILMKDDVKCINGETAPVQTTR